MSTPPCHHHPESRSNAQLTPSERESKRRLKAEVKFQRKVKTLETRIRHAVVRNDPLVEKSATEELKQLLSSKNADNGGGNYDRSQQQQQQSSSLCVTRRPNDDAQCQAALDEALAIFLRLLASIDDDDKEKIRIEKVKQTQKAKRLLRNMTKGTQSKSMFQDATTLRGYARQKFHKRAALVIESLGKLAPTSMELAASSHSMTGDNHLLDGGQQREYEQQKEVVGMCWEKLGGIETVLSLGCGPGNDAVGVTAFVRNYFDRRRDDGIGKIYMLDYAIDEWKNAILDNLVPILVPRYAGGVACASCDITRSLPSNVENDGVDVEQLVKDSDIFLMSYLLTETRNRWDEFLVRAVDLAKTGALFYFSEPVPWQLHRLIRMSTTQAESPGAAADAIPAAVDCSPLRKLRFAWIDSSMHYPDMQRLDRRPGGPAVLIAIKV